MAEPVVGGRCGPLDWAVCTTAYPGQTRSGDAFVLQETAAGVLIAVVDGLGHGDEAADVAERAVESLRSTAGQSPTASLLACHDALRGSRGAAITLAGLDSAQYRLTWVAVGNVDAAVVRRSRVGGPISRWSVPLRGGVVGDRLPPLHESSAPMAPDDVVVAATDGLASSFLHAVDPSMAAPDAARILHDEFARGNDDALVLVARCRAG